jgi:hypothetical protein
MSDPIRMNGPGLPAEILLALTPRPHPVDAPPPSHRIEPPRDPAAEFSSTRQDTTSRGDEQLLSDLRTLAEMHRAHQAARSVQGDVEDSSNDS